MNVRVHRTGRAVAILAIAAAMLSACKDAVPAADSASNGEAAKSHSAGDLEQALLTDFRGAQPTVGPQSGPFASFAAMGAGVSDGVVTDEPECVKATQAFDPDRLGGTSAALVAMSKMPDFMVSELIVTATEAAATPLLRDGLAESCREYDYTYQGDAVHVTIFDVSVPALGRAARALAIKSTYPKLNVDGTQYVVVFQADGYAASLSMVGAGADQATFIDYVNAAYAKAEQKLG